jgi:tetratricopeptide (TPR) repeat protein
MKKIVYIFILLFQFSFGQTVEESSQKVFEIANEMYKKGAYENAIQKYEFIEKSLKQESADLYFNLGNSYYKLNKVAPSIYYYEKALLLEPSNKAIKTNLAFAQKRTIDNIKVIEELGFTKFIKSATSIFSINTWTWLSAIFSVLTLLSFVLFLYNSAPNMKRFSFVSIFVALFLMIVSFLAANFLTNYKTKDKPAIIFEDTVEVKAEPKEDADNAFTLHEGTKVYIKETLDNYKRIQLTDKTEGWVLSSAIKEVRD